MKLSFFNFKLRQDWDKIKILFFSHYALVNLAIFFEYIIGEKSFFTGLLIVLLGAIFYRGIYQSMRYFYYTFWTFWTALIIFTLSKIFASNGFAFAEKCFSLYLLALLLQLVQGYIISSPLFYPRVRWWEYDFRFKVDLPLLIRRSSTGASTEQDPYVQARLTDLRRKALCVICFEKFAIGDSCSLKVDLNGRQVTFRVEVVSMREYLFGRGLIYGMKFVLPGLDNNSDYLTFLNFWKKNLKEKNQRRLMLT